MNEVAESMASHVIFDVCKHGRSHVMIIDCEWVRGERLITCAYTTP